MIVDRELPPFPSMAPSPWPEPEPEPEEEDIEDAPTLEAFPFLGRYIANPNANSHLWRNHANLR